jgi:calcium-dependent protein kinase
MSIIKKVDHPNIVDVYDTYESDDYYFIVMEYLDGGELMDFLAAKGPQGHLSEKNTALIMKQAFYAVSYLHRNLITHKDIQPKNFLLAKRNNLSTIKLIDFNLC